MKSDGVRSKGVDGEEPAQISEDLRLEAHQNEDAAERRRTGRRVRMEMDWRWRIGEKRETRAVGFGGGLTVAGLGHSQCWPASGGHLPS